MYKAVGFDASNIHTANKYLARRINRYTNRVRTGKAYVPKRQVLYHGTSLKAGKQIKQSGMRVSWKYSPGGDWRSVHNTLTSNKGYATLYSNRNRANKRGIVHIEIPRKKLDKYIALGFNEAGAFGFEGNEYGLKRHIPSSMIKNRRR
jgi:hypothetical protein